MEPKKGGRMRCDAFQKNRSHLTSPKEFMELERIARTWISDRRHHLSIEWVLGHKQVQARTGKGDFKAYHLTREHDSAILNCHRCSEETSRVYPYLCPGLAREQDLYLQSEGRPMSISQILDSEEDTLAFLEFIKSSDAFQPATPSTSTASNFQASN